MVTGSRVSQVAVECLIVARSSKVGQLRAPPPREAGNRPTTSHPLSRRPRAAARAPSFSAALCPSVAPWSHGRNGLQHAHAHSLSKSSGSSAEAPLVAQSPVGRGVACSIEAITRSSLSLSLSLLSPASYCFCPFLFLFYFRRHRMHH